MQSAFFLEAAALWNKKKRRMRGRRRPTSVRSIREKERQRKRKKFEKREKNLPQRLLSSSLYRTVPYSNKVLKREKEKNILHVAKAVHLYRAKEKEREEKYDGGWKEKNEEKERPFSSYFSPTFLLPFFLPSRDESRTIKERPNELAC